MKALDLPNEYLLKERVVYEYYIISRGNIFNMLFFIGEV